MWESGEVASVKVLLVMVVVGFSSYRAGRAFWSVIRAYLLKCLRDEVFNYSLLLLPGQLDGTAVFNSCPGYSTITVYFFCAVL
jgi:hypothetical protein